MRLYFLGFWIIGHVHVLIVDPLLFQHLPDLLGVAICAVDNDLLGRLRLITGFGIGSWWNRSDSLAKDCLILHESPSRC